MGKNAIIFGATSGIGRELAKLMIIDGFNVMITGRRLELLKTIQSENPKRYIIRQHDITDVEDSGKVFDEIPDIFDKVDIIVHNSGIGENNFDLEWEKDLPTLQTNVIGATRIYQLTYNFFELQGFGHLVSITSIASIRGSKIIPAYHASKAFQSNYMESLWMKAKNSKIAKIDITNILPGYIDTDIITGETFWMAPLDKATKQIYNAIKNKKQKAYITKRWLLIAILMKIVPTRLLMKFV